MRSLQSPPICSVTVGIPSIGDNPYVRAALEAALAALPPDGEIVISDNASPNPNSLAVLAGLDPAGRIRVIRHDRRISMADNWNSCIQEARGRHFLLLSDDDLIEPQFLDLARAALDDPCVGFAFCRVRFINDSGREYWTAPRVPALQSCDDTLLAVFKRRCVVVPCGTMYRTDDLRLAGGYDPNYGNWADMQAWIKIGARYRSVAFLPETLASYRERTSSLTKVVDDDAWADIIRKTIMFASAVMPTRKEVLSEQGQQYLEYMLADISLKRLVASHGTLPDYIANVRHLTRRLPARARAWLAMKALYLLFIFRRSAETRIG